MAVLPIPPAPFSVLVVNDRADQVDPNLLATHRRGAGSGLAVDWVGSVGDAFEHLGRNHYHAVYCDFFLHPDQLPPFAPDSPWFGTTVLRWVKQHRPTARRILTTSRLEDLIGGRDRDGHPHAARPDYLVPFTDALSTKGSVSPLAHYCILTPYTNLAQDVARAWEEHRSEYRLERIDISYDERDEEEVGWATTLAAGRLEYLENPLGGELFEVFRRLFATYRSPFRDERTGRDKERVSIDRVEISRLSKEGKSGAAVLRCTPFCGTHRGTRCVVKIDGVSGIRKEAEGFDSFVKYHRSNIRRVEVLSGVQLDQIGGACYTFAGGTSRPSVGLAGMFEKRDLRAITCLHANYHPGTREWFAEVDYETKRSLVNFFNVVHFQRAGDEPNHCHYADIIGRQNLRWHIQRFEHDHNLNGVLQMGFITDEDATRHQYLEYDSCIVHGDMNAGNLMAIPSTDLPIPWEGGGAGGVGKYAHWVRDHADYLKVEQESAARSAAAAADRDVEPALRPTRKWDRPRRLDDTHTIVIDYQFTMRGPIFIDFAALELSLRLSQGRDPDRPEPVSLDDIKRWADVEDRASRLAWADKPYDHALAADGNPEDWFGLGYWGTVSYELQRLARRNFEETYAAALDERDGRLDPATDRRASPGYWQQQYAATCLMWVARILKSKGLRGNLTQTPQGIYTNRLEDGGFGVMRVAIWARHLNLLLRQLDPRRTT